MPDEQSLQGVFFRSLHNQFMADETATTNGDFRHAR